MKPSTRPQFALASLFVALLFVVLVPYTAVAQSDHGLTNGGRKLTGELPTGMNGRTWRISPDGAHVVFTSFDGALNIRLYSVPTDGSTAPVELAANLSPKWSEAYTISADGRWVYFFSSPAGPEFDNNMLNAVPIQGGQTTTLYGPGAIIEYLLTPDQQHITLIDWSHGVSPVILPAQDSDAAPITTTAVITGSVNYVPDSLVVSPDSSTIAFMVQKIPPGNTEVDIYAMSTVDGDLWKLATHALGPVDVFSFNPPPLFSPDSQTTIYKGAATSPCAVCAVSVADGGITELVHAGEPADLHSAHVSPDGKHLVYQSFDLPPFGGEYLLLSVPLAGGALVQLDKLSDSGGIISPPQFTLNNESVLYLVQFLTDPDQELETQLRTTPIHRADSKPIELPLAQGQYVPWVLPTDDGDGLLAPVWQRKLNSPYPVAIETVAEYLVQVGEPQTTLLAAFDTADESGNAVGNGGLQRSNDGKWIIFEQFAGPYQAGRLYMAPPGEYPAQRVDAATMPSARVISAQIDPLSRFVVYNANQEGMGKDALYVSFFPDDVHLPSVVKR